MGWEFHDRKRDEKGRFSEEIKDYQLHIRCSWEIAEYVRHAARAERMSMTDFLIALIREDRARRLKNRAALTPFLHDRSYSPPQAYGLARRERSGGKQG